MRLANVANNFMQVIHVLIEPLFSEKIHYVKKVIKKEYIYIIMIFAKFKFNYVNCFYSFSFN